MKHTLPETNSLPLKIVVSNRNILLQWSIFKGELLVSGRVKLQICVACLPAVNAFSDELGKAEHSNRRRYCGHCKDVFFCHFCHTYDIPYLFCIFAAKTCQLALIGSSLAIWVNKLGVWGCVCCW